MPPAREGRTEDLIRRYLDERAHVWSEHTRRQERAALDRFRVFLAKRKPAGELVQAHVLAFIADVRSRVNARKGTPWKPATITGTLGAARRFLRWCFRHGHVLQDLGALIITPKPDRLPRALSEADVTKLLELGPRPGPLNARAAAVLEVLYGTGLRAAELARLDVGDVDLQQRLLLVRQGKGRKDRVIPFGESVRAAILRYLREGRDERPGALFLTRDGYRLHRLRVNGIVRDAGARAGVVASAHCLRHSFATHLLRNGASLPEIAALLGHASLQSTEIYLRVEVADLDRMIERSHPQERSRVRGHDKG